MCYNFEEFEIFCKIFVDMITNLARIALAFENYG